ncbi:MAG: hypothetical protein AUK30_08055 [Nitrospirae bacterium CG2_30_70_394]|nr:MAG: hypothetical protein AUK30_08055 [Nitrospirae bacterium CG2_30_70_394]
MERDRESVGLNPETQAILAELEEHGWFLEGQDIARFCMAYAIRAKITEGATAGTETRWAAGNFDKTGEIRALLAALYPSCVTPVRLMEHLVNEGLRIVAARVRSEAIGPAELMD